MEVGLRKEILILIFSARISNGKIFYILVDLPLPAEIFHVSICRRFPIVPRCVDVSGAT